MQTICGIYQIVQISQLRVVYIGSSKNTYARIVGHRYLLNDGTHRNQPLQRAWKKYGREDFAFAVIEVVEPDNLIEREQYWLDKLDPCFNIAKTAGRAQFGRVVSEETRRKIGDAHRGKIITVATRELLRKANVGKAPSPETKARISEANKGKKFTDEHRKCLSESQRGNKKFLGHKHTEESRAKIGLAKSGKVVSDETRKKMSESKMGKKRGPQTDEHKRKIGESNRSLMAEKKLDGLPPNHQAAKTHCPLGHPYSEENTTYTRGGRACRACNRIKCSQRYYANREEINRKRRERCKNESNKRKWTRRQRSTE